MVSTPIGRDATMLERMVGLSAPSRRESGHLSRLHFKPAVVAVPTRPPRAGSSVFGALRGLSALAERVLS